MTLAQIAENYMKKNPTNAHFEHAVRNAKFSRTRISRVFTFKDGSTLILK